MKDTADLAELITYLKENFVPGDQVVETFRSFGSMPSLWVKGGNRIWGDPNHSPDLNPGFLVKFPSDKEKEELKQPNYLEIRQHYNKVRQLWGDIFDQLLTAEDKEEINQKKPETRCELQQHFFLEKKNCTREYLDEAPILMKEEELIECSREPFEKPINSSIKSKVIEKSIYTADEVWDLLSIVAPKFTALAEKFWRFLI